MRSLHTKGPVYPPEKSRGVSLADLSSGALSGGESHVDRHHYPVNRTKHHSLLRDGRHHHPILSLVRARVGVAVNEDSTVLTRGIFEARMNRIGAKKHHITRTRVDRNRIGWIKRQIGKLFCGRLVVMAIKTNSANVARAGYKLKCPLSAVMSSMAISVWTKLPRPFRSDQVSLPLSRC